MKEIGQSFKEAREKIEITKEEVIKDLNITMGQLENLEVGNANAKHQLWINRQNHQADMKSMLDVRRM